MKTPGHIARLRRRLRATGVVLLVLTGIGFALDRLFPPDLTRIAHTSAMVLDSDDRLLRAFTASDGRWRLPARADRVDPLYRRMLLAYEDKRFRLHPGVDPLAVGRALAQMAAHRRIVSGASTITMQTARLLKPRPRTFAGKLAEMLRALQLEGRFAKDDILAMYLTLAPFGGNLEGVRAASLAYLGKEPRRLTPGEAALLVALPQSPTRLRPDRFPERARAARDRVLDRMEHAGVLSARQAAEARGEAVPTVRRPLPLRAPHLARRLAAERPGVALHRTTIDGQLQSTLEQLVRLEHGDIEPRATIAVLAVENATRRIVAYVGSSDFFNDALAGQIDMTRAVRSPGSALKPFIYGIAFDDMRIHPETIVIDQPTRFGDYEPKNFRGLYRGEVTVRHALQQSLNIPAVAMLDGIGPGRFTTRLRNAGARLRYAGRPGLAIALGGAGTTLADLVTLYAGLANGGTVAPLVVRRPATDAPSGPPGYRIFGRTAAWYLGRIMAATAPPEKFLAAENEKHPRAIAFKTGTSYGFRDAWAIGYDGGYDGGHTVGVWVGRPDGTPSPDRYGRNTAAPLLFRVFGLLPDGGHPAAERPDEAIVASNAELPERLRRYAPRSRQPAGLARALTRAFAITFPPDGAELRLERTKDGIAALPLAAEGGATPLHWLVNGRPIPSAPHRRRADWRPDGEGFVRITVIDAEGRAARAEALLK